MANRYITEREVSMITGLALSTLRNDRARAGRRRIPFVKIGKAVRYLESDVIAYMESYRVGRPNEPRRPQTATAARGASGRRDGMEPANCLKMRVNYETTS